VFGTERLGGFEGRSFILCTALALFSAEELIVLQH
jgi:hypothetical protein